MDRDIAQGVPICVSHGDDNGLFVTGLPADVLWRDCQRCLGVGGVLDGEYE